MRCRKNQMKHLNNSVFSGCFVLFSVFFSETSFANDLLSGRDLQESPFSLSLTTTVQMTIGSQTQQLVISQYGIFNITTTSQMLNAANSIFISQEGIGNMANVIQSGYGNTVTLQQQGDNNLAELTQEGNANIANIQQFGEQNFTVHQIGNEMVVNITQY